MMYWLCGGTTVGLIVYLFFVLLKPEYF
ncbi:MAG: potassium-transporting ATPase subunit F [Legionellaceae bacterium]|nr:potassium-transporting ATPase subunit F [Legionellaceae bacterium]MBP9775637.1 potassium-transporting ATPase subunit F [Legionellaceae bacterium]